MKQSIAKWLIIIFLSAVFFFGLGLMIQHQFKFLTKVKYFTNQFSSYSTQKNDLQKVSIEFETNDYDEIKNWLYENQGTSFVPDSIKKYKEASFTIDNSDLNIKARLKGSLPDHIDINFPSFKLKSDSVLFNKSKQFSIHHPKARGFLNEWLFHQICAKNTINNLHYDFIHLTVNDDNFGIYAIEQELKNYKNNEGITFQINDDFYWNELKRQPNLHGYYTTGYDAFFNSELKFKSKISAEQENNINRLWNDLTDEKIPLDSLFDFNSWTKYLSICDILGAQHGLLWFNLSFYLDNKTNKIFPIAGDGTILGESQNFLPYHPFFASFYAKNNTLITQLLKNKAFSELYFSYLYQFSTTNIIDKQIEDLKDFEYYSAQLQKSFPDEPLASSEKILKTIQKNKTYIKTAFELEDALFIRKDSTQTLIGNRQIIPIEIISIDDENLENPIYIKGRNTYESIQFDTLSVLNSIEYKALGNNVIFSKKVK